MAKSPLVIVGMIITFLAFISMSILYFGLPKSTNNIENIKSACINLCLEAKKNGMDLSNGPCLSDNNPSWNFADWVCDVAHMPRKPVDNLPANQCQDFRSGKAHHFVEVDENCQVIKVY